MPTIPKHLLPARAQAYIEKERRKWSQHKASQGWMVVYPRDLEFDPPSFAGAGRPYIRQQLAFQKAGGLPGAPGRVRRVISAIHTTLPPPDAPGAIWSEWEASELRRLASTLGGRRWLLRKGVVGSRAALRRRVPLLRLLKGKPLYWVARASGMTRLRCSAVLRGRGRPSFPEVRRLARALGITMEELGRHLDRVQVDPI